MFYPNTNQTNNNREMTSTFLGYNHNPVISDGEFYDMWNMSSDHYPLLTPREKRNVIMQLKNTEWDKREATFTKTVHGDLSSVYHEYTATISAEPTRKLRVSFEVDEEYVDHTEIAFSSLDKNGNIIDTQEGEEYITVPETASVTLYIDDYAIDPDNFDPDTDYITDILVEEYNDTVRGILCKNNKLAYMIGQNLYYGDDVYNLFDYLPSWDDLYSRVKLLSFGAYILIFPLGIYFNTADPTDIGRMDAAYQVANTITYTLCNKSGTAVNPTVSDTAPENPSEGDYWLNTGTEEPGLYVWSNSLMMWSGVATTYIKLSIPGSITGLFSEGDAVFLNTKFEEINNGSVIHAIGESSSVSYIVVTGIMNVATTTETFSESNPFTIERRLPDLDYVCVSQNRVWGCYYGESEDGVLNEIHASKLGDFKNWYVFDGTAADSYTLSMGDDGAFTGAITYRGYPMFFKENNVYRIYGSYPAAYQLSSMDCRGVQEGSDKSIAIVGEYLIYKAVADVCVFDGSTPVGISQALGDVKYHDAVGGAGINKYYLSMLDENGKAALFVYDFKTGIWCKEDDLRILEFSYNKSGRLYGQSGQTVYGFEEAQDEFGLSSEKEEELYWYVISGLLGLDSPDHKMPGRITIRADIPVGAEIKIFISYDEKKWSQVSILTGKGRLTSYSVVPDPLRSDNYRLKLEGHKGSKIYSITRTYDDGSEEE